MKTCELCKSMATIYCDSDSANLCWTCDAKVHSANFLVARHSRSLLCHQCQSPTPWSASGEKLWPSTESVCRSCVVDGFSDDTGEGVGGDNGEIGNGFGDETELKDSVVARSSALVPPAASSSSSEELMAGGFLKRKRQKVVYVTHEDEINSSSVNINRHSRSSTMSSSVGTVGENKKLLSDRNIISGEYMHAPVLLRSGKSRRTIEIDLNL